MFINMNYEVEVWDIHLSKLEWHTAAFFLGGALLY